MTHSVSPGRIPSRRSSRRGRTRPVAVTSTVSGPGVRARLPPTSAAPPRVASSTAPSTSASKWASGRSSGSTSDSSSHCGRAAIAARSLRFTATARRPIAAGGHQRAFEVDAVDQGVGGLDEPFAARRGEHRGVVADADDHVAAGRRHPSSNRGDEVELVAIADRHREPRGRRRCCRRRLEGAPRVPCGEDC